MNFPIFVHEFPIIKKELHIACDFFFNRLLGGIPSVKELAPPASLVHKNKLLQISVLDLFVLNFHPVVNLFNFLSDREL